MDMIIEGGVALRDRLQFIVEINHNLTEWHIESDLHTVARDILLLDEITTFAETKRHNRSDKLSSSDDCSADIGFFDMVNERRVR